MASLHWEFAGVSHWAALAALLAAGTCILELGQSYKKTVRNRTTFWLGAACLFSLVPDLAAMLADEPEKNWTWMLPPAFLLRHAGGVRPEPVDTLPAAALRGLLLRAVRHPPGAGDSFRGP